MHFADAGCQYNVAAIADAGADAGKALPDDEPWWRATLGESASPAVPGMGSASQGRGSGGVFAAQMGMASVYGAKVGMSVREISAFVAALLSSLSHVTHAIMCVMRASPARHSRVPARRIVSPRPRSRARRRWRWRHARSLSLICRST